MRPKTSEHSPLQQDFNEEDFRRIAKQDGVTHISTGVAVVKDGKLLLVRRAASDYLGGNYELPGGGVDANESIVDSALRELQEETGLVASRVVGSFPGFDYKTDKKPHVRQINFIVKVETNSIHLNPNEHDDYKWVTDQDTSLLNMSANMQTCVQNATELIKRL